MSEQTAGVAPGTLSGINLAGDEASEATLPPEDDRTLPETPEDAPAPAETPEEAPAPETPAETPDEPEEEPQGAVDAPPAPETETAGDDGGQPPEPPDAPPATAEPEAGKKKGAPARPYVVLREDVFDNGEKYTTIVHEVEARNAQNAMRQAFRDLSGPEQSDEAEATLVVIPKSMYRPTRVRLAKTERVSVQFG